MNLTPQEKVINGFIARKPDLAIEFLRSQKVPLSSEPTLNEITARLYERYYQNDKAFNEALGKIIANGDNVGFVITTSLIIGLVTAGVTTGITAGTAKSKFERDKRIAENQAQVAKNAAAQQTEAQKEAGRAQAVATSIADYKMQLEAESTARRKNAVIFVAAIGVIGIVAALILKK